MRLVAKREGWIALARPPPPEDGMSAFGSSTKAIAGAAVLPGGNVVRFGEWVQRYAIAVPGQLRLYEDNACQKAKEVIDIRCVEKNILVSENPKLITIFFSMQWRYS